MHKMTGEEFVCDDFCVVFMSIPLGFILDGWECLEHCPLPIL